MDCESILWDLWAISFHLTLTFGYLVCYCGDLSFKCEGFTDVLLPTALLSKFWIIPYVSLRLRVQNAVSAQPCVGKLRISLVLLNFLHCNFRLWFETP